MRRGSFMLLTELPFLPMCVCVQTQCLPIVERVEQKGYRQGRYACTGVHSSSDRPCMSLNSTLTPHITSWESSFLLQKRNMSPSLCACLLRSKWHCFQCAEDCSLDTALNSCSEWLLTPFAMRRWQGKTCSRFMALGLARCLHARCWAGFFYASHTQMWYKARKLLLLKKNQVFYLQTKDMNAFWDFLPTSETSSHFCAIVRLQSYTHFPESKPCEAQCVLLQSRHA